MANKEKLLQFLLKARTQTYVGCKGKVKPALAGSKQLEYKAGEWFYRDIYFNGEGIFMGIETICFKSKAVWAMSYFGDYQGMTEQEIDSILRAALLANWQIARTWRKVIWQKDNYQYVCQPDFNGSVAKIAGKEKILKDKKQIYWLWYAGGLLK